MYILQDSLRARLKEPLGTLVRDAEITKERLDSEMSGSAMIISVGDATTSRLAELGIRADIEIVDGQERRTERTPPESHAATSVSCENAAGTISDAALDTLTLSLESPRPVRITVRGEEDLLVLPLCTMCPPDSAIAYGQPGEGMVIARVDDSVRNKATEILATMQRVDDEPVAE